MSCTTGFCFQRQSIWDSTGFPSMPQLFTVAVNMTFLKACLSTELFPIRSVLLHLSCTREISHNIQPHLDNKKFKTVFPLLFMSPSVHIKFCAPWFVFTSDISFSTSLLS